MRALEALGMGGDYPFTPGSVRKKARAPRIWAAEKDKKKKKACGLRRWRVLALPPLPHSHRQRKKRPAFRLSIYEV